MNISVVQTKKNYDAVNTANNWRSSEQTTVDIVTDFKEHSQLQATRGEHAEE